VVNSIITDYTCTQHLLWSGDSRITDDVYYSMCWHERSDYAW